LNGKIIHSIIRPLWDLLIANVGYIPQDGDVSCSGCRDSYRQNH